MNKQAVIVVALLGITGYSYTKEAIAKDEAVVTVTSEIRVEKDMVADVIEEAKEDAKALKEKYEPVCGIDTVKTTIKRSAKEGDEKVTKACSSSCNCGCRSCSSGNCCCRSVKRSAKEEDEKEITKACSSSCNCGCRSCSSGSCCSCRSVKRSAKEGEEEITKACSSSCNCGCRSCSSGNCCSCRSVTIEDDNCCEAHIAEGTRVACEACEKIKEGNERKRQKQRELQQQQQQNKSVRALNEDNACECHIAAAKCEDCGNVTSEFRCSCGNSSPNQDEVVRCNCGGNQPTQDEEK